MDGKVSSKDRVHVNEWNWHAGRPKVNFKFHSFCSTDDNIGFQIQNSFDPFTLKHVRHYK